MNVTNEKSSFIWILQTANYYARLPINYDGWVLGQPGNSHGIEYCLVLVHTVNYFWDDKYCTWHYVSVCEIDIA